MKFKRFIQLCLIKLKHYWQSKINQDELEQEVYDGILLMKFNAIKEQLMKTDKTFLVGLILSEKIKDDSDIHCYYNNLQDYKKEISSSL